MGDTEHRDTPTHKADYRRDPRSPMPLNENVTKYMRSNRSKDTKPEMLLRRKMWEAGIRGYRLHWKKAPGKPDIAFPGKKMAIFMNGCFWHRCPHCNLGMPKHNAEFWQEKFARNVTRDREKQQALADDGWKVLVIWECELLADVENQLQKVRDLLGQ
jgi:DNA mismatch endonuclease (patch repair protein)